MQCVALVLQCVAVCCSVLQRVALVNQVAERKTVAVSCIINAVCCISAAVCCNVLQCVAACWISESSCRAQDCGSHGGRGLGFKGEV